MKNSIFNWHKHGLLLFVAVTFGVSLSYLGVSYFNHQSRAAALPLLQYISPDRIVSPPKYPICPHLIDATIPGSIPAIPAYQDLCTDLYWAINDATSTFGSPSTTMAGSDWYNAIGKNANGTPITAPKCTGVFKLPTPDQLLTLAFIPCGEIKYCENSGTTPIFCSEDKDCPRVQVPPTKGYCSEAKTISCSTDVTSRDCEKLGVGSCKIPSGKYCSGQDTISCEDDDDCGQSGAGTCQPPPSNGVRYSCIADTCSPITRRFGSFQGTVLNTPLVKPVNYTSAKTKTNADASYWTSQEVDGLQGSQCSANPSVSCTATGGQCAGTCDGVGSTPDQTGGGTVYAKGVCSNAKEVKCYASSDCNIGSCELSESAVSVNLKYGTVNNPIMGKNALLNVRCVYEPVQP